MSPNALTLFGLLSNLCVTLFGLASFFIALWQNARARLNQYLALTMLMLALSGLPSGFIFIAQQFELEPETLIYSGTTLYMLAVAALFFFLTEYERENRRRLIAGRLLAAGWAATITLMTLTGKLWSEPSPQAHGDYTYHLTTSGTLSVGLALLSLGFVAFLRGYRLTDQRSPVLWAISPIVLGGATIAFRLPYAPVCNSVLSLVSMVMVTRVVLNNQLFNPLLELYHQLALKNAQLEEATRRKSEFLANMSHELRTPLNSIIGYTELVTHGTYGDLNQMQSDRLEKVNQNGKRLLALINNVLDLSKIDAGKLDIHPVKVSPAALIDEVLKTLQPLADEKGLVVTRSYEGLPPLYVDEMRVRQIILNIIANAIQFTSSGGVTISGTLDALRRQVVISVRDTGVGIRAEDAGQIFEALKQPDPATALEKQRSAGLGLAVTKRLIELHGGRVWFESVPTQGSTFYIALPAAVAALDEQAQRQLDLARQTILVDGSRPLVLVIDDDLEAVEVIQGYLEREGYQVYGALSGREGILRACELSPTVITLDIFMPGMDGWAVLEALQAQEQLRAIPVVVISVLEQVHMAREMGAFSWVAKPLNRRALLSVIQQAHEHSLNLKSGAAAHPLRAEVRG